MWIVGIAALASLAYYVEHCRRTTPSEQLPFWFCMGLALPWIVGVLYMGAGLLRWIRSW